MDAAAASQALFGRDTEIASIAAFLGRESHSDVGALILSGDAGVGKSALLERRPVQRQPAATQSSERQAPRPSPRWASPL